MSRSRLIRILIALVLIVGAGFVLYPRIISEIRSNGVINARVVTVQAPIGGTIVREFPVVGLVVDENVILTRIIDDTESQGLVSSLTLERDSLLIRIEALETRLSESRKMSGSLEVRIDRYAQARLETIEFLIQEANARRVYWQAVLTERSNALVRNRELVQRGAVSSVRLEELQSEQAQAREEVNRAQADIGRLERELEAAGEGVFVGDGQNDVPYSQQRLDEVLIRIADLELELAQAEGRLAAIGEQLGIETTRAERREAAMVRSPVEGIVWRRFMSANSVVTRNTDLLKILDCSTLFVEIAISEETAETLDIGDPVVVRLQGSDTRYDATVREIRGTRSVTPGVEYAASPPVLKRDELLLVAGFTHEGVYEQPESFCDVGRRAEVTIGGAGTTAEGG